MTIKKNKSRLEVYGVSIDNKETQTILKSLGYKWYPIKQCWTKWTTDTVEELENKIAITITENSSGEKQGLTVPKNENIVANCVYDEDYGWDFSNDLNSEIDRLNHIINELKAAGVPKKKVVAKKKMTIDLSKFTAKKPTLDILKEYTVLNGYVYTTDMEKYCKVKKETIGCNLEDGIYKSIDPVVKSDIPLSDCVELPKIIGTKKELNESQWTELRDAIVETMFYIQEKNYTPIFAGVYVKGNKVVGTDPYQLFEVTLSFDTGLNIIIPKSSIEVIKQQYGHVTLHYSDISLSIDNGDMITHTLLIKGNRPERDAKAIMPDMLEGYKMIDLSNIGVLEKEMKIKNEFGVTIDGITLSKNQLKQIKTFDYLYSSGDGKPLINYNGNKRYVVRPCK